MNRAQAEALLAERIARRQAREFEAADAIRAQLREGGWEVLDSADGSELQALKAPTQSGEKPEPRALTLLTVVHGWRPDVERWLLSVFTNTKADFEALLVDNSGDARMAGWLESRAAERLRLITLDPPVGFATAVNAGIEAAAGEVVVLFDPGFEVTGDAITPLLEALAQGIRRGSRPRGRRHRGLLHGVPPLRRRGGAGFRSQVPLLPHRRHRVQLQAARSGWTSGRRRRFAIDKARTPPLGGDATR